PPGEVALHGDGLEVLRPALEEQHHAAVVDRQLGDAGAVRDEPEREAAARLDRAAVAEAHDVRAGIGAQVAHEAESLDLSHGTSPSRLASALRPGEAKQLRRAERDALLTKTGRFEHALVEHAPAERRLVEAHAEDRLVDILQGAQGELSRQQLEADPAVV